MFLALLINRYDVQDSEVVGARFLTLKDAKLGLANHLNVDSDEIEWVKGVNGLTGNDGEEESYLIIEVA